jgi:SNF family Na+-dependent transporter
MCGCQKNTKISGMATQKNSNIKDVFYGAIAGGVGAFIVNAVVRSVPALKDNSIAQIAVPMAKFAVGTYAALGKGMTPMVRGIGVGMGVIGGIESVNHFLPPNFKMSGIDGISGYGYGGGEGVNYYEDPSSRYLNSFERHAANRIEPVTTYNTAYAPV